MVTFKQKELPNSLTYQHLEGLMLVFETMNINCSDEKYVFQIPIKFYMGKPEPELITKTIMYYHILDTITITTTFLKNCICFSFPVVDHYSSKYINPKKFLILKNNGDAECVFSVIKETDYQREHTYNGDYLQIY